MTLLNDPPVAGDLTEEILTYLETGDARRTGSRSPLWSDNVGQFDGAFPIDEALGRWSDMPAMLEDELEDPAKWPVWPIDVAFCNKVEGSDGMWAFHRTRTCSPKEARGRASIITQRMVSSSGTYVSEGGIRTPTRVFYAHVGGRWTYAHKTPRSPRPNGVFGRDDINCEMNIAFTASLTRRYEWSVCLGFEGPSVRFLTDPVGVREAFALRDVPPGKTRRAALRHWVSEHTRKKRHDDAALIEVRKHLRGATSFTWNGMRCRIEPSLLDQEQAAPP